MSGIVPTKNIAESVPISIVEGRGPAESCGYPGTGSESDRGKNEPILVRKQSAFETINGPARGQSKSVPGDVPAYDYRPASHFEETWHLAAWSPNELGGPTVLLNRDADLFEDSIRYFQNMWLPIDADEVEKEVLKCYGDIAVCKIAHSHHLKKFIPIEVVDLKYRSPEALTLALMGLYAEEAVILRRLQSSIGKRLTTAASS